MAKSNQFFRKLVVGRVAHSKFGIYKSEISMKVFKFGGASVKDANAVINMRQILTAHSHEQLFIVISAMGKTTNKLEDVVFAFIQGEGWREKFEAVFDFHKQILMDLMPTEHEECLETLKKINHYANTFLDQDESGDPDFIYDQIVSLGEIMSTKIIASYLSACGFPVLWADARKLIHTDNTYREAKVNWKESTKRIDAFLKESNGQTLITQGFIGGGDHNRMTTLGREGSDFSAAIIAHCINAESITIWKDVPGMLNADPKHFSNTTLLQNISYREAVELSYYGASVIHPKTIKPLENKHIPLFVKSFLEPQAPGTLINDNTAEDSKIPSYIFKPNQVLVSISSRDFSFIVEEHISDIFKRFAAHRLKIQTMQNSAISFSVSIENNTAQLDKLIQDLQKDYVVLYNEGLDLLTIRHYNENTVNELIKGRSILLEQKTRHTMRVLMRGESE